MKASVWSIALAVSLLASPKPSLAASVVFEGDPVDGASGRPHEILPGMPLLLPGPDGIVGTADDAIDASKIGDIDIVLRTGSPAASEVIPAPLAKGGRPALPVGVAGSTAAGGTPIAFTVFLSDGAVAADAPYGKLLAAADMDGIPVIVAAFADWDGDGIIGPAGHSSRRDALEVRELEAVGRAVAIFGGGVARGSISVRAGLPASAGGLRVALTAQALTGPFDPGFLDGAIPSGPAISTAQPFVPERNLTKLLRDRAVPVSPTTTLQQVVQFAVLPSSHGALSFRLPLNGTSPTIDAAIVRSQAAVGVAFREAGPWRISSPPSGEQDIGSRVPANRRRFRLLAVDRWGNPADPPGGYSATLRTSPPMRVFGPGGAGHARTFKIETPAGIAFQVSAPAGTADGVSGLITADRGDIALAHLSYTVTTVSNRPLADAAVSSDDASSLQQAVDAVSDVNNDGLLVVSLRPGIFTQNVVVSRPVLLRGAGVNRTILQGGGVGSVVTLAAPGARVEGLTAIGGSEGFTLSAAGAQLVDVRAWRNLGAGVRIAGSGGIVERVASADNGGAGLLANATNGVACSDSSFVDNAGYGVDLSSLQNASLLGNAIVDNGTGGISLNGVSSSQVIGNQSVNAFAGPNGAGGEGAVGAGIGMFSSQDNQIIANLVTRNDDDGLRVDQTDTNLISANVFDLNGGYGMFVRRSTDDFSADAGVQDAPGDNVASGNRKGDVFFRVK